MTAKDFSASVTNPFRGAGVTYTEETASTMEDARRLLLEGAPHGTVVVSDYQHQGQGRKADRHWNAPPGEALLFTLILRSDVPLTALSLRAGLAVARVLSSRHALEPRVKWPNDILLSDRKVCGVLCRQGATWGLVGIGLNVNQSSFPSGLESATSLYLERGVESDRAGLLESLLGLLQEETRTEEPIRGRLQEWLYGLGREVEVLQDDGTATRGRLQGLTDRGALIVDTSEGAEELHTGELRVLG